MTLRILMLEDNPHDAELVRRELARGGVEAEITHARGIIAFREAASCGGFDVVLADYDVPGVCGMEALDVALAAMPGVPFLYVSGAIGEERAVAALHHGATDYIIKDRLSRLPSAVARALRERDEQRLRHEAQERFRLAAKATRDLIWEWYVGASSVWVNEALQTEWEWRDAGQQVSLAFCRDLLHPADADHVFDALQEAIDSAQVEWEARYRLRRGDGTYGIVENRGIIVRDAAQRATRVVGAVHDLTALVERERELERERRISGLGRVAAVIAHEVNNVLMIVQSHADTVRRRGHDEPVRLTAASRILDAVARGRRITHDILRAANPGEPSPRTLDAAAWLGEVASEIERLLPDGIRLVTEVPSEPVCVHCDPQQLHQVLLNLAVNARDALAGFGTIRLGVRVNDGTAVFTVSDTGSGIPEDVLPRIFEPLFTTKRNGTGLGLSVVRQLVTRNGGTITVASQAGAGTAFTIVLPLGVPTPI
jgi:phosphoserine phosphatase RsbU/P